MSLQLHAKDYLLKVVTTLKVSNCFTHVFLPQVEDSLLFEHVESVNKQTEYMTAYMVMPQ